MSSIGHKEQKSKAKLKLSDIQGFSFGGINSRFWKMRKYINNLDRSELAILPFYSWECISIETKYR
jgi:hypothetical protein